MHNPLLFLQFSWCVVLVNVGGNLLGFFIVQLLLHYAHPAGEWEISGLVDAPTSIALLAFLMPTAVLILLALAAPVNKVTAALKRQKQVPESALNDARRRAINLPFQAALMNLLAWILPAVAFPVAQAFRGRIPLFSVGLYILYSFTNALMITLLVFVLLQYACSKTAIPVLFPRGHLGDQTGTLRLSIRTRLMVIYCAICLLPMFQIALVVHTGSRQALTQAEPLQVLSNLGTFSLILFLFTAAYGLWLVVLLAKSLSEPVEEIMSVAEKVRVGDFETNVQVVSNDEIGYLGDRVNEMSRGLRDRQRVREMFDLFTSPEIGERILSGGVSTDGEIREATLLFSDLRGFTAMAERLSPKQVVESVNAYFSAMSEAIVQHGGIILQYVGDEIEAVFGAPVADPDHADKAVVAALAMRTLLEKLNGERAVAGREPLQHGIGVHTGHALAGIIGSKYKISYALVGDTVNLASRIQDLTKKLNTDILISGVTYQALKTKPQISGPVRISVKGKQQPVDVFILK
jgi:adenylate cyclase